MPLTLRRKVTLVLLIVAIAVGCSRPSGPRLEVSPLAIDLGVVRSEDVVSAVLNLRNPGSETVQIGGLEFGCGCTKAEAPKSLEPGESADVKILFQPNVEWSGERIEKGMIRSNDPLHPDQQFTVRVDLKPPIEIEPRSAQIIPFVPGQAVRPTVSFTPRADKKKGFFVRLKNAPPGVKVNPSNDQFALDLPDSFKMPGDHEINLTFDSSIGPIDYRFVLQASEGPVSNPARIEASLSNDKKGFKIRELHLYSRKGVITVRSIVSDDPALGVEFEATEKSYRAAVSYRGGWKVGIHEGFLKVITEDQKYPILKIPYRVRVAR